MDRFPRQWITIRPRHLETPKSYLRRLCVANSIDFEWLQKKVRKRRLDHGADLREIGVVIAELGGPAPAWFEAAHARARLGYPSLRGPWDRQPIARLACLSCTAGESVITYPHVRFAFCLRHSRWLGREQRVGVLDAETYTAERSLRRLVSSGDVDRDLYETTWELVRDNAYLVGESAWPERLRRAREQAGFTREVDDRIAMFPRTVRALGVTSSREFDQMVRSRQHDDTIRRAYLYRAFEWAGPERWVLVEGIEQFFDREAERVT